MFAIYTLAVFFAIGFIGLLIYAVAVPIIATKDILESRRNAREGYVEAYIIE